MEALVILERLKLPWDDRTDTNFIAPIRMHFWISQSTLDSLKSVSMHLEGNHRWVPLLGITEVCERGTICQ